MIIDFECYSNVLDPRKAMDSFMSKYKNTNLTFMYRMHIFFELYSVQAQLV